jgi:hypothetical protein
MMNERDETTLNVIQFAITHAPKRHYVAALTMNQNGVVTHEDIRLYPCPRLQAEAIYDASMLLNYRRIPIENSERRP